jgi:excisionase family DNA binding protein
MRTTEETTTRQDNTASAVPISGKEQQEILDIYQKLRRAEAKLIGPDGETRILPSTLYSFLLTLLATLKNGHSVTILQSNASLTTVEASKLLGISRQFLVKLLEKNELAHHKVGTHRRLYVRDVLAYKSKRDTARRKNLDDLSRAEHEEGIYNRVPDDFNPGQ